MNQQDWIGTKYAVGAGRIAVQRMRRIGFSAMPRPHAHPYYELYALLEGERVYFMNGGVYTARKGDVVVVVPHDLHSTASSQVEQFERILVHFAPECLEPSGELLQQPPFRESALIRIPPREQPEIERLLLQMVGECKEAQPLYEDYVRLLLHELLIRLRRAHATGTAQPGSDHPMHQKITEIASYIHARYRETLTLEELAKRFYISPSYLSRIFPKLTGLHVGEYIRIVRIREAQRLLRTTRLKVQDVSERVGFEHISHFNKTFKKVTGVSPLRYRNSDRLNR